MARLTALRDEREPPTLKWSLWIAGALIALGVTTRFWHLGTASLFLDEVFSFERAQSCSDGTVLNDLLACFLFRIFGESELVFRLPSAIAGALTFPVVFYVADRLWNRWTGIVAVTLLIFNPFLLSNAHFGRYYSKVFLLTLVALYLFHSAFETGRLRRMVGAIAATGVAIVFHKTAALVLIVAAVYAVFVLLLKQSTKAQRRTAKAYLGVCALGAVVAVPAAFSVLSDWSAGSDRWGFSGLSFVLQLVRYFGLSLLFVASVTLVLDSQKRPVTTLFWITAFGLPIVSTLR